MRYKVQIYQTAGASEEKVNVEKSTLLGEAEYVIGDLLQLKKTGLCVPLQNPHAPLVDKIIQKQNSTCTMRYEMIEQTNTLIKVQFKVSGGLNENYLLYKLSRIREMNDYVVFYTSKRAKSDYIKGAKWEPAEIPIKVMCRNDPDRPIKIEVFEWKRVKGQVWQFFVTELPLTLSKIQESVGITMPMYANKLAHGKLKILNFDRKYQFQFIDYIHGGCDIAVLLAMDFTLNNKHFRNSQSLHYMPSANTTDKTDQSGNLIASVADVSNLNRGSTKTTTRVEQMIKKQRGVGQNVTNKKRQKQLEDAAQKQKVIYMNEYQEALYMTMTIMEAYDNDMHIPFLGFGAKLPPFFATSSSCFALNGNIFKPECEGTQGLLETY